ncbi:MAG: DUF4440 domain-containing protein, partial [Bacteroidota bacterium]
MKKYLILILVSLSIVSFGKPKPKKKAVVNPRIEIQTLLSNQQKAWNEFNLEGYMQGYWKSDSLTFVGKRGVTRGWKNTFDNYKKSYPDKSAMGKLELQVLSIKLFGADVAFVVGKWDLQRTAGDVGGHFT